jgi:beta-hydroxylase
MKWLVIGIYVVSVLHVHLRGRVRLPLRRQLVDHSTFMAPINVFMHLFSKAPSTALIPIAALPELAPLQRHWQTIRAEAEQLQKLRQQGPRGSEDPNLDAFFKKGWKSFYLKWYDVVHASAQRLCPQTVALLHSIPAIKVATFAELPAGGKISPHRDPFAGWVRYHLGLSTPCSAGCFIEVDGVRHCWCDGQVLIFDETYLHWADNDSTDARLILLCDIERPMRFRWAQAINHGLGRALTTATSPQHVAGAQTGLAGRLSRIVAGCGQQRRRLKASSMGAYRAMLAAAALGIVMLVWWL